MNILFVCEIFDRGGLETHILTFYNELKRKGYNIYFAFKEITNPDLFDHVYTGFNFNYDCKIHELSEDVERLVQIINTKNIDVIHVHPWYGLLPAAFASSITKKKLFYTAHGSISIDYLQNSYDQLMFEYVLNDIVCNTFCVSEMCAKKLDSLFIDNKSILLNPIDINVFNQAKIANNKKWAFITRLDTDKTEIVKKIIKILPELDIDQIDIFGDGNSFDEIKNMAESSAKPVKMKGHIDNLYEVLSNGYHGIIGIGRCVAEGLIMGFPVLFAGYGKICGLVDEKMYKNASVNNFVPLPFAEIDICELNRQLAISYKHPETFNLREKAIVDHNVELITNDLLSVYQGCSSNCDYDRVFQFYNLIKCFPLGDCLYNNVNCFDAFSKCLGKSTSNSYLREKILLCQENVVVHRTNEKLTHEKKTLENLVKEKTDLEKKYRDDITDLKKNYKDDTETKDAYIYALEEANQYLENQMNKIVNSKAYKFSVYLRKLVHFHR